MLVEALIRGPWIRNQMLKMINYGDENYEIFQNYWWKHTLDMQFHCYIDNLIKSITNIEHYKFLSRYLSHIQLTFFNFSNILLKFSHLRHWYWYWNCWPKFWFNAIFGYAKTNFKLNIWFPVVRKEIYSLKFWLCFSFYNLAFFDISAQDKGQCWS